AAVLSRVQPRLYSGDPWPSNTLLRDWYAMARGEVHHDEPGHVRSQPAFSGLVVPISEQRRQPALARAHGTRSHLDAARLWNAAGALEVPHAQVAEGFASVSVCFSKGLGAPVGSALAGDAETIRRARRGRKLLGGGMRQAGIIAAGALYALRHHRDRVVEDHARAATLADRISGQIG